MRMRRAFFAASLLLAAAAFAAPADAPETVYQNAYRLVREAKLADYRGDADLAASKWEQARALLGRLDREHPAWNRETVQGQLAEVEARVAGVAPSAARASAVSLAEARTLSARLEHLEAAKAAGLRQAEWERRKLLDLEGYARTFARKERARRVLGLARGTTISLADIRRAEAAQPTPTPEANPKKREEVREVVEERKQADARLDTDKDGLTDLEEAAHGTDPQKADTDGDGLLDGDEVKKHATDPLDPDSDDDGDSDGFEVDEGYDPLEPFGEY